MARWITVRRPFDYRFADRSAMLSFAEHPDHPFPREEFHRDEVADYAVAQGHATEGRAEGSTTRSTKGKTRRAKGRRLAANAAPANNGTDPGMDAADHPDNGAAEAGRAVDPAAGER